MKRRYARPEEWDVLLQGHHEAFISWAEYLKNQETLMHNRNQLGETVRGAPRAGKGLLAGLLRCGHCGKKMRVRYGGRSDRSATAVYYQCTASQGQPANSFAAYVAVSKLSKRLPMPFWQRSRRSGWRRLLRRQISWPKRGHRNGSSLNWNLSAPVSRPAVTGVNMMQSSQKIALWQGLSNAAGMRRWRV